MWVENVMKSIINKTIFLLVISILCFILFSSTIVLAADFSNPKLHLNGLSQDASFSINNLSQTSQAKLYLKKFDDLSWNEIPLSYNNYNLHGIIPSSLLDAEGVYEYYVQDSSKRFPDNPAIKKFVLSDKESVYLSKLNSLIQSQQDGSSWYCTPFTPSQNYLSCFWSNMNAAESLRFAQAYDLSSNETYKNLSLNLAFAKFNNDSLYSNDSRLCDAYQNDFNCSSFSPGAGIYFSGALRQGESINFFSQVASILNNDSVLNISKNYALGSAQECNVWAGDFNCSCVVTNDKCVDSDNQGSMILAYWNLYELTGNQTYKFIAKNLSDKGIFFPPSPILLQAFSKAYELTANPDYESKIYSLANQLLSSCRSSSCTSLKRSEFINAFLDAYKQTNSFIYKQEATKILLENTSSSCNPFLGDFVCDDSLEQGRITSTFFNAYNDLPKNKKIFAVYPNTLPIMDSALPLDFSLDGFQENLTLHYRLTLDNWNELNFSYWNDSIFIPSSYLDTYGYYEYYVTSSSSRFPANNASITIVLPTSFNEIQSSFRGLLNNDSNSSCDPRQTNPALNDFSCQRENFQGFSGQGFYDSIFALNSSESNLRNNLTSIIGNLSSSYIDLDSGYDVQSSCEHLNNDFVCNYRAPDFSDPLQERGAIRQSLMIILELDAYQLTHKQIFLDNAIKYLQSRNDECDPYTQDYTCREETLGYLSYAYYKAYALTGETIFLNIANDLSNLIIAQTSDVYTEMAGLALWSAYDLTANNSYLVKARNITDYYLNDCIVSDSCTAKTLGLNTLLMWDAVRNEHGSRSDYMNKAVINVQYGVPKFSGQYCDPVNGKFSCKTPQDQGALLSSYAKSISSLVGFGNSSYEINVSTPNNVNYSSTFPVTCFVKNLNQTSGFDLFLISTFDIISASSDIGTVDDSLKKITFPSATSGSVNNATWILNATWGLPTSVRCAVLNYQNSSLITVRNIFNVLSINDSYTLFLKNNTSSLFSFKLNNTVNFDLKNVTVKASLLYENYSVINDSSLVLESINASKPSDTINSSTILIKDIFVSESPYIYLNISSNVTGDYVLKIEANTTYGGYEKRVFPFHVYEENPFRINYNIPQITSVNDIINITSRITFLRNFSLKDFSLRLNNTNLSFLSSGIINSSSTFNKLSDGIFFTNNLLPLDTINVYWEGYFSSVGNYNLLISGDSLKPSVRFQTSDSNIQVSGNVFNSTLTLSPNVDTFEKGDTFTLSLDFFQESDINLTNVTASLSNFTGLNMISSSTNILDESLVNCSLSSAKNISQDNITSLVNKTDGVFLDEFAPFLQLNFSLANIDPTYNFTSIKLLINANTSGNMTVSILNNSLEQEVCSFSNNTAILTNYSCELPVLAFSPSDDFAFILFNSTSNISIDSITLSINSEKEIKSGINTSLLKSTYPTLEPLKHVASTWVFQLLSLQTASLNVKILSNQGAYKYHSITLSPIITPTVPSKSGSGGGYYLPKTKIVYSYDDYILCDEIKPFPDIYNITLYNQTCLLKENTSILTNTLNALSCINISRYFVNGTSALSVNISCLDKNKTVYILDNISKNIFNSTKDFTINSIANKSILDSDPLLLFSSESKSFKILYYEENSSNKLSSFSRPIFFVTDPIILDNDSSEIINETNSSGSNIMKKEDNSSSNSKKSEPIVPIVSISSKKLFNKISSSFKQNTHSLYVLVIILVFVGSIYFANKKGLLSSSRSLFILRRSRKRNRKDEVIVPWSFKENVLALFFKRFISLKEKVFLESSSSELKVLKNISLDELFISIAFSLKDLSFNSKDFALSDNSISQLRLLRLYLAKLIDFSDNLSSKNYELKTLFGKLDLFFVASKDYFSKHKSLKKEYKTSAKNLIKEIFTLTSDLKAQFNKENIAK